MVGIALDLGRHAIFDRHENGAGIGAVMRASGPDEGRGHRINPEKNVEKPILYTIPETAAPVLARAASEGLQ
jgi:hypothetical protein